MEELQEADILWPEQEDCNGDEEACTADYSSCSADDGSQRSASFPIKIPSKSSHAGRRRYFDEDDGSMIPPHVMIARRRSTECRAASLMCVGNGRTLRGRDLRRVRDSILQMTGFLEMPRRTPEN
ncbi:hypothetical protein Cni_G00124 [Canna indica]|uniref:Senescence regulator n=1 Tax=Canna indica TaxID=4628 RepID=A0AAQ3PWP3_9LILI|nr:hypothetical protein Cni_G00124 [Canna indica]